MSTFGIPREVRDLEMRVGLTPAGVLSLTRAGHTVYIEQGAGQGAGFSDEDYRRAGGSIVYTAREAYGRSDIVVKMARPTEDEYELFRPQQTIFSFLHLGVASPDLYQALQEKEITAVSYELITDEVGQFPVMLPASEIAGRMAPIIAGQMLRSDQQGLGILLGGLPGVAPADVVIIGAGTVGINAAHAFSSLGAEIVVLDRNVDALRHLSRLLPHPVTTMFANRYNLQKTMKYADVLIGAVHVSGSRAPMAISREMVSQMRPGSVIIDFAIDEGGCIETSRPTTLRDPVFVAEGVYHYCVPNMTAVCARTASYAHTNAALPFLRAAGEFGVLGASQQRPAFRSGISLYEGGIAHPAIAAALGRPQGIDLESMGGAL